MKSKLMHSRRKFVQQFAGGAAALASLPHSPWFLAASQRPWNPDVAIVGGSLGGVAAALAALRRGARVLITEETAWLGGQLTSQGVPPDEHRWIETKGSNASYRALRSQIRQYYRRHYPVSSSLQSVQYFNPGSGSVSRLCHEPKVAKAVIDELLAPYVSSGQCVIWTRHRPVNAEVDSDEIRTVVLENVTDGQLTQISAPIFIDATELGDLLALSQTEYVTGSESQENTGEWHAGATTRVSNHQAFTMCFAIDYVEGEDHTIDPPDNDSFWKTFEPELQPKWPGRLLDWTYTHPRTLEPRLLGFNPGKGAFNGIINLWKYRRMIAAANFQPGTYRGDISLVNWPQNDYFLGSLIDVSVDEWAAHVADAKALSLSLLHWMQTEAPRHDGGKGYPGLRLRSDIMGSDDGLALYPYVRESRRIQAVYTLTEKDCGKAQRQEAFKASGRVPILGESYRDSVGVGSYPIDLHPTTGGDNYIDFETLPFELPLRAMIPVRVRNLIPACKNIGTTHLTNGCYRLHPVEWGIGEAAGSLGVTLAASGDPVQAFGTLSSKVDGFCESLRQQGVETAWQEPL